MRIVDIIDEKKKGLELTKDEINYFITSLVNGSMPDYQASAWLMAVWFKGMTEDETAYLTEAMLNSGERIDFGYLAKQIVDKHSTGGVGDKVTITLIPLLAAAGIPIAKLSGKGLGHTGGTIDKLESIPGFNCNLTIEKLKEQVEKIGVAIGQQTGNLTPADGKLYALRDVTATVDSLPLICSSVVSKKIAAGADNIVLDVKYGSGAFMKTPEKAVELARLMVKTGQKLNKQITAVVTSMEEPLGRAVGNSLEIIESVEFLKGNIVTGDIAELTYDFAVIALMLTGKFLDENTARSYLQELIHSGQALDKFKELIAAQGGNTDVTEDYSLFEQAKYKIEVPSKKSGYVSKIDAYNIAYGCKLLGAGREKKTDSIDYSVGVFLNKKTGEKVIEGDILYTIYANSEDKAELCKKYCDDAFEFSFEQPEAIKPIYEVIKA
ncbi:MAG: thymidine phosphorylase [Candidatus Gastranaerophilaceae bacterium]|nr:thymidine phosphorylase [Candidatus Gastranaerophilaceae bacterium]